jgi:hypothetical protein
MIPYVIFLAPSITKYNPQSFDFKHPQSNSFKSVTVLQQYEKG